MQVVQLPHYNIYVGDNVVKALCDFVASKSYSKISVIVDQNTKEHCLPLFEESFSCAFDLIEIPAGEENKTLDTCQHIWKSLFTAENTRKALVINLGGGVIGDMGGFCASTYKRGIDFIQCPTTLLSQVDASIGGKLGIDFFELKNSIGVFNDPQGVFISTDFYKTLPFEELRSGYAEVLKHALIWNAEEWNKLQQETDLKKINWHDYLVTSLSVKKEVVEIDPFEKGLRKALNFGHTIGHAIESDLLMTPQRLLHGEAIAIGMICEAYLSKKVGLSDDALNRISTYLVSIYGHHPVDESSYDRLLAIMKQDKKNEASEINITMLPEEGKCAVNQSATPEEIIESINYYNQL